MFGRVEELLVVLVIILVLFGAKKLPELSKSIGSSVREVRNGISETTEMVKTGTAVKPQQNDDENRPK